MSLIFEFDNITNGEKFIKEVKEKYKFDGKIYTDDSFYSNEMFPFVVEYPVVCIERATLFDSYIELEIQSIAPEFGGEFIGT